MDINSSQLLKLKDFSDRRACTSNGDQVVELVSRQIEVGKQVYTMFSFRDFSPLLLLKQERDEKQEMHMFYTCI